jgi:hypothetical protein
MAHIHLIAPTERNHLEEQGINGRIISKWNFLCQHQRIQTILNNLRIQMIGL